MNYLSVTGRSVDYGAAACNDAYVAAYHDDISRLESGDAVDLGIFSNAPPSGGGQITLSDAGLVQTPVDETGTVKGIRSLGAPYVRAADLGTGNGDQSVCTGSAATGRTAAGGTASAGRTTGTASGVILRAPTGGSFS